MSEQTVAEKAFNAVMTDQNCLILGEGGTGKSTLIQSIMDLFGEETILVAPTGLAAITIGGQTCHSTFRMPFHVPSEDDLKNSDKLRKCFGVRSPTRRIVFDEIGMLTSGYMWFIDQQLRILRKKDIPFGGLQAILIGDFLQLGAVMRQEDKAKQWYTHGFPEMFNYKAWDEFNFKVYNLTKVYRQKDQVFKDVLGRIRLDRHTQADLDYLNTRVKKYSGPKPVVCLTNYTCEEINRKEFNKLQGEKVTFQGYAVEFKERPVPEKIHLKVGARVIICTNKVNAQATGEEDKMHYVNGDLGEVVQINEKWVKVKLDRNGEVKKVSPFTWLKYEVVKEGDKLKRVEKGHYNQLPVKLAYGMTAHKIQGQTLEEMHFDLERDSYREYHTKHQQNEADKRRSGFLAGLVYVGLSRVKSLEGLTLQRPILMTDIVVNDRCTKFMEAIENDPETNT